MDFRDLLRQPRLTLLVALVTVVILAPLVGVFAFGPLLVAMDFQPWPLAAALGVMLAEALSIAALVWLVLRRK